MEDVVENEPEPVPVLHRQSLPQFSRGAYRKFRAKFRSTNSSARGGASDFSGQKSSDQNSPSIEPGHGSSTSWVEGGNKDSSKSNQARLRSYVHEKEQRDYDTESTESEAKDIGDAGESFVMNWEMKAGRTPKKMPINNEGYDIVSESPEGLRYIEVKSIDGAWGARGVGVTRAQYDTAIKFGSNWWLYIVEHARDGGRSVVTPIQNPFHQATEFRFDPPVPI
nr:DUF3883 domain-containing protein [Methylicorpusculum oleiharenae]